MCVTKVLPWPKGRMGHLDLRKRSKRLRCYIRLRNRCDCGRNSVSRSGFMPFKEDAGKQEKVKELEGSKGCFIVRDTKSFVCAIYQRN